MIVKLRATIQRKPPVDAPWKIVAGVTLNRLHASQRQPRVQRQQVRTNQERADKRREPKKEHFRRVRVLGRNPERRRVLVVDGVYVLVEPGGVEGAVAPVECDVFRDEEECELEEHCRQRGEGGDGVGRA